MKNYKNYFDHEIRVKAVDGIMSHSQEWEWLIDYIENNFDLNDITSWDEYMHKYRRLSDVFTLLIKIVDIDAADIHSEVDVLQDIINVAMFYVGRISQNECAATVNTNYGWLLYFVVLVTKIENSDNETDYVFDFGLFTYRNYWQLVSLESMDLCSDALNAITGLDIEGWNSVSKVFIDNTKNVLYEYAEDFFERVGNSIFNANIFNYQDITLDPACTWEEQFLADMVNTSLARGELTSAITLRGSEYPDKKRWTRDVLDIMDSFFNDERVSFVIRTVGYILYDDVPDDTVIIDHFDLLNNYIDSNTERESISCSSFKIIAKLFVNKNIGNAVRQKQSFKDVIQKIQSFEEPSVISMIKNIGFPTSKHQDNLLRMDTEQYYSKAGAIGEIRELLAFLEERKDARFINNEQLELINEKFIDMLETDTSIIVASLFYEYMNFLIDVNSRGIDINKSILHRYMINTQMLWEYEYFDKQCGNMQTFEYGASIPTDEVEEFNNKAKVSPIIVANTAGLASSDQLCDAMVTISEHAILYLTSSYNIKASFPEKTTSIDCSKNEIYKLLGDTVAWLIKEKGYTFLNILEKEKYVIGINRDYMQRVQMILSLLHDERGLYKRVEECIDIKLIDYDNNLKLAHVTQLFPILETKIRDFARVVGYFPFKKTTDLFMQFNDPSTILREIIADSCKGIHGFDPVSDLLFIYNCMYNTHSLNIRNECIHGRGYLSQRGLHLALRATLISIMMIEQRLQTIFYNRRKNVEEKKSRE